MAAARKRKRKGVTTLSISLSAELQRSIVRLVESGQYASASEVIREALRLLLRTQAEGLGEGASAEARRLVTAIDLAESGKALRKQKRVRRTPVRRSADPELGPGLRLAPERLKKLRRS
jgi:putative addiction module CopG family antidote